MHDAAHGLLCASVLAQSAGNYAAEREFAQRVRDDSAAFARHQVGGLLLRRGPLLVTWLEGPQDALQSLWPTVLADDQHHSVAPLWHGALPTGRLFPALGLRQAHITRRELAELVRQVRSVQSDNLWPQASGAALATLMVLLDRELGFAVAASLAPNPPG
jgi:Sensors of blue-light using FAD